MTTALSQPETAAGAEPAISAVGDPWIADQLRTVRSVRSLLGALPAFRRGRMYFDFDAGKVCIAQEGGAEC